MRAAVVIQIDLETSLFLIQLDRKSRGNILKLNLYSTPQYDNLQNAFHAGAAALSRETLVIKLG